LSSLVGDVFAIKDGIKGHIVNGIFVPYNQEGNVTKAAVTTWRRKERPTYNNYNGSYAQDEMGFSDDDIDIIFDGDPDAYWNID